jgi:hypothetical protein
VGLTLILGLFHKKDEESEKATENDAPPRIKSQVKG